jgi:hypothetical protein
MNPKPSHEDRFRLEFEDEEMLAVGESEAAPADIAGGGPSSFSSTSPTDASDIRIIPDFFSNSMKRLSWLEYRRLAAVDEDVLR